MNLLRALRPTLRRVAVPALAVVVLGTGSAGVGTVLSAATDAPRPQPAAAARVSPDLPALDAAVAEAPARPAPATASSAPSAAPSPAVREVAVGPLTGMVAPDVLFRVDRTITPAERAELEDLDHLSHLVIVDSGRVGRGSAGLSVLGVDPTATRGLTPPPTAASDPLWTALGKGDLVADLERQKTLRPELGKQVTLRGAAARDDQVRLGGLATLGLGDVDGLVSRDRARALGLAPDSGALVTAPGRSTASLTRAAKRIFGDDVTVTVLRPAAASGDDGYRGKPRSYRELYMAGARTCPGTVLDAARRDRPGRERPRAQRRGLQRRRDGPDAVPALDLGRATASTATVTATRTSPTRSTRCYGAARYLCACGAGRGRAVALRRDLRLQPRRLVRPARPGPRRPLPLSRRPQRPATQSRGRSAAATARAAPRRRPRGSRASKPWPSSRSTPAPGAPLATSGIGAAGADGAGEGDAAGAADASAAATAPTWAATTRAEGCALGGVTDLRDARHDGPGGGVGDLADGEPALRELVGDGLGQPAAVGGVQHPHRDRGRGGQGRVPARRGGRADARAGADGEPGRVVAPDEEQVPGDRGGEHDERDQQHGDGGAATTPAVRTRWG